MYVILTTKPGQFRTEVGPGLKPVEAYDYVFYGRTRARFLIAEISGETRVRIVDETEPVTVNDVPSKFLEKFETLERARRELHVAGSDAVIREALARHASRWSGLGWRLSGGVLCPPTTPPVSSP